MNKKHNVTIKEGITFYGGNKGDNIESIDATIYCGSGNNTLTLKHGDLVFCGSGNNTIKADSYCWIYGGSGVNNITVSGRYNYIESGSASMNVTLKGSDNTIYGVLPPFGL